MARTIGLRGRRRWTLQRLVEPGEPAGIGMRPGLALWTTWLPHRACRFGRPTHGTIMTTGC